MKPGTYRLTADYTPPSTDRRSTDWRKAPARKGSLFHVVLPDMDGLPADALVAFPPGHLSLRVANVGRNAWTDFFNLLEPVPDKPSYMLEREYGGGAAIRALDRLFDEGTVTLDELRRVLCP